MLSGNGTSFADPIQASTPQMTPEPTWLYLTSAQWVAVTPVLSYWMASAFYEFIDAFDFFPQHRIHPTAEECKKNLAKRSYVLRHVLIMHLVQLIAGFALAKFQAPETAAEGGFGSFSWFSQQIGQFLVLYSQPSNEQIVDFGATKLALIARMAYLAARQFLALIILDSWVFWTHYLEHTVPWLYRKFNLLPNTHTQSLLILLQQATS